MARQAKAVADDVRSRTKGLEQYLAKVESLVADKKLSNTDAKRAYSGAFLIHYNVVENALEKLFVGALRGRIAFPSSQVRVLVEVKSDQVARAMVKGSQRYIDWIPYANTRRRPTPSFQKDCHSPLSSEATRTS